VREFCDLLKQEPYKLNLEVANGLRADMVNEEILTALKEVGLRNVGFGIESGNDRVLKLIKKGITKDQVRKAVRIARDIGLETWGFFILGLPGDNEESIQDTIDFAIELNPKYAKFVFLKPFPGSEAFYQLEEKGLIVADTAPLAQAQLSQIVRRVAQAQQPAIVFKATEFTAPRAFGDAYGEVQMAVSLECGIEQIVNFLSDMSNQPELVSVTEIQFGQVAGKLKLVPARIAFSGIVPRRLVPEKKGAAAF